MADRFFAETLIADTLADKLSADKAYHLSAVRSLAAALGIGTVIPTKANCKEQLSFNHYLYRYRHLVGNHFWDFKHWRGIATLYAKRLDSFAVAIEEIRVIGIRLKILQRY